MEQIIIFASIIAIVTSGILKAVKSKSLIPKKFIPITGIGIGVLIGGLSVFIPELLTNLSLGGRLLAGLISGLMATGLWENVKHVKSKDINNLGAGSENKAPKK